MSSNPSPLNAEHDFVGALHKPLVGMVVFAWLAISFAALMTAAVLNLILLIACLPGLLRQRHLKRARGRRTLDGAYRAMESEP